MKSFHQKLINGVRILAAFSIFSQTMLQLLFSPVYAEFNQDDNKGFYDVTVISDDVGIDLYNSVYTDNTMNVIRLEEGSTNGWYITNDIEPASSMGWTNATIDGTSLSISSMPKIDILSCNSNSFITTTTPTFSGTTQAQVDLTALGLNSQTCLRMKVYMKGNSTSPLISRTKVSWIPKPVTDLAFVSTPVLTAGSCGTYITKYSFSYANDTGAVVYVKLPEYNSSVTPPTPGYNQFPSHNPTFDGASHNGIYTTSATAINGVSIPANSVYWNVDNGIVGQSKNLSFRLCSPIGTETNTQYQFTASIKSANTILLTAQGTTLINSAPIGELNKYASGELGQYLQGAYYNGTDALLYSLKSNKNITYLFDANNGFYNQSATEQIFNPIIDIDFTNTFGQLATTCFDGSNNISQKRVTLPAGYSWLSPMSAIARRSLPNHMLSIDRSIGSFKTDFGASGSAYGDCIGNNIIFTTNIIFDGDNTSPLTYQYPVKLVNSDPTPPPVPSGGGDQLLLGGNIRGHNSFEGRELSAANKYDSSNKQIDEDTYFYYSPSAFNDTERVIAGSLITTRIPDGFEIVDVIETPNYRLTNDIPVALSGYLFTPHGGQGGVGCTPPYPGVGCAQSNIQSNTYGGFGAPGATDGWGNLTLPKNSLFGAIMEGTYNPILFNQNNIGYFSLPALPNSLNTIFTGKLPQITNSHKLFYNDSANSITSVPTFDYSNFNLGSVPTNIGGTWTSSLTSNTKWIGFYQKCLQNSIEPGHTQNDGNVCDKISVVGPWIILKKTTPTNVCNSTSTANIFQSRLFGAYMSNNSLNRDSDFSTLQQEFGSINPGACFGGDVCDKSNNFGGFNYQFYNESANSVETINPSAGLSPSLRFEQESSTKISIGGVNHLRYNYFNGQTNLTNGKIIINLPSVNGLTQGVDAIQSASNTYTVINGNQISVSLGGIAAGQSGSFQLDLYYPVTPNNGGNIVVTGDITGDGACKSLSQSISKTFTFDNSYLTPQLDTVKYVSEAVIPATGTLDYALNIKGSGTTGTSNTWIVDKIPVGMTFVEAYIGGAISSHSNFSGLGGAYTCTNCQVYFSTTGVTALTPGQSGFANAIKGNMGGTFTLGTDNGGGVWTSPFGASTTWIAIKVDDADGSFKLNGNKTAGFRVQNVSNRPGDTIINEAGTISNELLQSISNQVETTLVGDSADRKFELQLSKLVNNQISYTGTVGQTVSYTIRLSNISGDVAKQIIVKDPLPVGITYAGGVSAEVNLGGVTGVYNNIGYDSGTNTIWATGLQLGSGDYADIILPVTITANSGTIINTANINSVSGTELGVDPVCGPYCTGTGTVGANTGTAFITVSSNPIYNLDGHVYHDVDWNSGYNAGDAYLNGVTVTLTTSTGLTFTAVTNPSGYYQFTGLSTGLYTVSYTPATAPGLAPYTSTGGYIAGQQVGTGSLNGGTNPVQIVAINLTNNSVNNDFGLVQPFDIGISKAVNGQPAVSLALGGQAVYTLTVRNNTGGVAQNITVNDALPTQYNYGTHNASQGTYSTSTNQWIIGSLSSGQVATLTITGTTSSTFAGSYTNTGSITAFSGVDIDPTNHTGTAIITTLLTLDGYIYHDADWNSGHNNLESYLSGVTVTLKTSTGAIIGTTQTDINGYYIFIGLSIGQYEVSYDPSTAPGLAPYTSTGGYIAGSQNGSGSLNGGASTTTITSINLISNSTHNDFGLVKPFDIGLTKTVNGTSSINLPLGGQAVYVLTVTNHTGGIAQNISVDDALPAPYVYASHNVTQGTYSTSTNQWIIGNLSSGQSVTLTITGNTNNTFIGSYTNTGSISAFSGIDINPTNHTGVAIINTVSYSIDGHVYHDANWNSGLNAEPLLSGVLVTLFVPGGGTLTTITSITGYYIFTGLAPGQYDVSYDPLTATGYVPYSSIGGTISGTQAGSGSLNGGPDNTAVRKISLSDNSINNDFGLVQPASLSGCVYLDSGLLLNKVLDAGDGQLGGVPITLSGTTILGVPVTFTANTMPNGCYEFSGLVPGIYDVTYGNNTPYLPWSVNTGTINTIPTGVTQGLNILQTITLGNNQSSIANNFGLRKVFDLAITKTLITANPRAGQPLDYVITYYNSGDAKANVFISDIFSHQLNYSGVISATPVIPSPTIVGNSITWSGITIAANSTGTIVVQFILQTGLNDDIVINTGVVGTDWGITFETNTGNNTGFTSTGLLSTLCGKVYVDNAEDDIYNGSDILMSGLTVYLKVGNTILQSKTTSLAGGYCFTGLLTGMYTVTYDPPIQYLPIDSLVGTVDGVPRGTHLDLITLSNIVIYAGEDSVMNDFTLTPRRPDLWVIKQVDKTRYFSGDVIVWTITYGNSGDIDAPNSVLTDLGGDKWNPDTQTGWNLGTLAPGQTGQVTITGHVFGYPLETGTNTVVISTPRIETRYDNNSFTGTFPLTWPENISIQGCIYYDKDWSHNLNPSELMLSGITVELSGIDNFMRPKYATTQTDQLGCYSFIISGSLAVATQITMVTGYSSPITYKPWTSHAGNVSGEIVGQGRQQNNATDPTLIKDIVLMMGENSVRNDFGLVLPDLTTKIVCSPRISYPQDPYECTITVTNNSPFCAQDVSSTTQIMQGVTVTEKPSYCTLTDSGILTPQTLRCAQNQLELCGGETKTYTFKGIIPQTAVRDQYFVFPTRVAIPNTETRYDNNDSVDQIGIKYRPVCEGSSCSGSPYTPIKDPDPVPPTPKPDPTPTPLPEPIKELLSLVDRFRSVIHPAPRLPATGVEESIINHTNNYDMLIFLILTCVLLSSLLIMKRNYGLLALVVIVGIATSAATRADFNIVDVYDPATTSQFIGLINGLDGVSQERKNKVSNFLRTASQQVPAALPKIEIHASATDTGVVSTGIIETGILLTGASEIGIQSTGVIETGIIIHPETPISTNTGNLETGGSITQPSTEKNNDVQSIAE